MDFKTIFKVEPQVNDKVKIMSNHITGHKFVTNEIYRVYRVDINQKKVQLYKKDNNASHVWVDFEEVYTQKNVDLKITKKNIKEISDFLQTLNDEEEFTIDELEKRFKTLNIIKEIKESQYDDVKLISIIEKHITCV